MTPVLLVRPLCAGDEPEFAEPLGLERIAGYLRARGADDVRVFDRRLFAAERKAGIAGEEAPAFFERLREAYADGRAPGVVGLSLMTAADIPDARRIIVRLRSWWPQARFVAGGVYVTGAPVEAAQSLPQGVVLQRGEGEELLYALACGAPGPCADLGAAETPDAWCMPYRPDLVRYSTLGCAVNMQASRGCPGSCAFCATPQLPPELRKWQPRSIDLVADEMEREAARLQTASLPAAFNFVDDDFGPLARVEELATELERRRLRVAFSLEMRLASLARQPRLAQRLVRLHEAGLFRVFFGLESLNRESLARWRKPDVLEELPDVISSFRSSGVEMQAGYILWHGAQTVEGARVEVERLHELGIYTHQMGISRLIVFPGCALGAEGVLTEGYQAMCEEAERFHERFSHETAALARRWKALAVEEPAAAARALLSGQDACLSAIREELHELNERSFEAFMRMS